MSTLTDQIFSQISGAAMQQIGQQLGTGQARPPARSLPRCR